MKELNFKKRQTSPTWTYVCEEVERVDPKNICNFLSKFLSFCTFSENVIIITIIIINVIQV
jgi:hypothetical protein